MTPPRPNAVSVFLALALVSLATGVTACASAPPAEPSRSPQVPGLVPLPPPPAPTAGAPSAAAAGVAATGTETRCAARVGARAVRRSALSRTLDAGLGTWLRGVDIEPKVERGRFRGWKVRGIYAGDPCWSDIDIKVGDVVNRINRRPIERPEEAQAVWTALRDASEIIVDFSRAGEPQTLRFTVVDDPS